MWFFGRKKNLKESGLLVGSIDHHSHILPGVDDGVKTLPDALEILAKHEEAGVKVLWLTPHIMEDYPNTPETLRQHFARLREAYKGSITLHLAAEYMLDNFFEEILEKGNLLPIGQEGNHLLVETSYYTPPMRLYGTLERIKSKGYFPLLAHAERYLYLEKEDYLKLREKGVKFQLNIPSLAGVYGSEVQKKATWLLDNEMYAVTGSDTHCSRAIKTLEQTTLSSKLCKNLEKIIAKEI